MKFFKKAIKKVSVSKKFSKCSTSLSYFEKKIEELKILANDPYSFINEEFFNLRNDIDIERELSKELIDKHFLSLIDQLNGIEAECKEKMSRPKDFIETEVEKYQLKLKHLKNESLNLDIRHETDDQILKLKEVILDIQGQLVLNNSYHFVTSLENEILNTKIVIENVSSAL